MEFFNFGNHATYHFFCWANKALDVPALMAKSFGQVEQDEWFKMGEDVCVVARDKLAEELEEVMLDRIGIAELWEDGAIGSVDESEESLIRPMMYLSLEQIDFGTVAQAMLIQAKKWAPDRTTPELFPLPEEQDEPE